MRFLRIQAMSLISFGILALVLSSCGGPVKQVDALVNEADNAAGVVVEYRSMIDKSSVTSDSFSVPGRKINMLFVSNSNPIKDDKDAKSIVSEGGRYVVILLKPGENKLDPDEPIELMTGSKPQKVEVRVKQVAPVTTTSGKVIKPWDKSLKPTNYYVVNGGLSK